MSVLASTNPETLRRFVEGLPKVELHLHIEGSLEPEMLFALAKRNNRTLKFADVDAVRKAYAFTNLQSFLDIYYEGMGVLLVEQDFYDLTMAYFDRIHADKVRHAEIFFDPQGHTERGVSFETVVLGITRAMKDAEAKLGITSALILSFLRHLSEEDAFATLKEAEPFRKHFVAVGLDSSEVGHPPKKFERVFAEARKQGYLTVAHGGEEGTADPYITDALDVLEVSRVDHGIRCLESAELLDRLKASQMPLTVCPLSNLKLRTVDTLADHPMKKLLDAGLCAMINSDDPAYFGGYMNENFLQTALATEMSVAHVHKAAVNGINATFASAERKAALHAELEAFVAAFTAEAA